MEPIEEQMRTLLVDIVRNCQSTVANNFERLNTSSGSIRAAVQPLIRDTYVAHAAAGQSSERVNGSREDSSNAGPALDEEPYRLNEELIARTPATSHCAAANIDQGSDSGYGNLFSPCECPCHLSNGLNSTLPGKLCIQSDVCINIDFLLQTAYASIVVLTTLTRGLSELYDPASV